MTIKVGIIGAAGFAGAELVRLVLNHPEFSLEAAASDELAGTPISKAYPAFAGSEEIIFCTRDDQKLKACTLVFMAVPHKAAMAVASDYINRGITVVDLSADFRLKDPKVYEQWYETPHVAQDLLKEASFGLPELFPEAMDCAANTVAAGKPALIACAGCYPTATSLAAAPLIRTLGEDAVLSPIVVDAISGVSGAGRGATLRTHFCLADENLEAYGVAGHRHLPEIEQILGVDHKVIFTPHLAPLNRGLLSTVTLALKDSVLSQEKLQDIYEDFYKDQPFVSVLRDMQPKTASVTGTNRALVAAKYDERTNAVIATCAIDNIGKGAAGQAIQCANMAFGLPQTCGLTSIAVPA